MRGMLEALATLVTRVQFGEERGWRGRRCAGAERRSRADRTPRSVRGLLRRSGRVGPGSRRTLRRPGRRSEPLTAAQRPTPRAGTTLSESALPPGDPFILTAEVRNAGGADADAAATTRRYYRSADGMIVPSTELGAAGAGAGGGGRRGGVARAGGAGVDSRASVWQDCPMRREAVSHDVTTTPRCRRSWTPP